MAEVAQQPPEPGGAALAGLVVGDDAHARADAGAAGGGLEARRAAAADGGRRGAGWGGQVAVEVEQRRARDVALAPGALAGAGVGEHEAAVDHREGRLAEVRSPASPRSPVGRTVRSRVASVDPTAAGAPCLGRARQARNPRGRSRAAARLGAAEALERRRDGSPGGRAERHSAVACIDLDVLVGGGIQAGAPVDDSVTARIDRHEADVGAEGPGELLPEAGTAVALEAGALEESRRA